MSSGKKRKSGEKKLTPKRKVFRRKPSELGLFLRRQLEINRESRRKKYAKSRGIKYVPLKDRPKKAKRDRRPPQPGSTGYSLWLRRSKAKKTGFKFRKGKKAQNRIGRTTSRVYSIGFSDSKNGTIVDTEQLQAVLDVEKAEAEENGVKIILRVYLECRFKDQDDEDEPETIWFPLRRQFLVNDSLDLQTLLFNLNMTIEAYAIEYVASIEITATNFIPE